MSDLTREHCTACRGGEPTLTAAVVAQLLPQVPQWRVRVETWTHAIGGLHRNDFILAARIDALPVG
jgi:hypothetical protein